MRLFQAGVDKKIVKEITGHASDALIRYQVTSMKQKEAVSKILNNHKRSDNLEEVPKAKLRPVEMPYQVLSFQSQIIVIKVLLHSIVVVH